MVVLGVAAAAAATAAAAAGVSKVRPGWFALPQPGALPLVL